MSAALTARLKRAEARLPRAGSEGAGLLIVDGGAGILAAPVRFDFAREAPDPDGFPWAETDAARLGAAWVADAVASLERTRARRERFEREQAEACANAVEMKPTRTSPNEATEEPEKDGTWRIA